jgi:spermidine synthase/S-adenosylmethionine decarboxylase
LKGLHIIADWYACGEHEALTSARALEALCVGVCHGVGLTVLGQLFHQFDGLSESAQGGATGAVVFAESHLAIHTWPERQGATLDVYVCNVTADNGARAEQLYQELKRAFAPAEELVERVSRGRDLPLANKKIAA